MRDASQAFMLVLNFIGMILLFALGGWLLDRWQDTSPTFTLIGLAVGFGGGIYQFFRAATRLGKPSKGDDRKD
jgi:F0F1-type ATP synthase assembly protein I